MALARELLAEDGSMYILSAKLNQDPLEQYFSKQRSLRGCAENPDVRSFAYNHLKLLVSGSSAVGAATHGNTTPEEVETVLSQPLPKRQKKQ